MTKRFLVLQHVAVEHPGIFRQFMAEESIAWDAIELDMGEPLPDPQSYQALIVMGGPMDVWEEGKFPWLAAEKEFIRSWVEELQRPFLGICLGHQLLAAALGGEVGSAAQSEVGVLPVALTNSGRRHGFFRDAPPEFACLQWHDAEVTRAPVDAQVLAASEHCAIQALACGPRAFSFQFHVEVTATTITDWSVIPAYEQSLFEALGEGATARLQAAATDNMTDFNQLARLIYDNWRREAFQ